MSGFAEVNERKNLKMETDRLEQGLMEGSETRWAPIVVKGTLFAVGIGGLPTSSGAQESVASGVLLFRRPP